MAHASFSFPATQNFIRDKHFEHRVKVFFLRCIIRKNDHFGCVTGKVILALKGNIIKSKIKIVEGLVFFVLLRVLWVTFQLLVTGK